jgi:hypothetical protein
LPEFRASPPQGFFFKGFCGDHAENNLAIFGFILDVKVGKTKPFLCSSLPTTGTYHKNMAI